MKEETLWKRYNVAVAERLQFLYTTAASPIKYSGPQPIQQKGELHNVIKIAQTLSFIGSHYSNNHGDSGNQEKCFLFPNYGVQSPSLRARGVIIFSIFLSPQKSSRQLSVRDYDGFVSLNKTKQMLKFQHQIPQNMALFINKVWGQQDGSADQGA